MNNSSTYEATRQLYPSEELYPSMTLYPGSSPTKERQPLHNDNPDMQLINLMRHIEETMKVPDQDVLALVPKRYKEGFDALIEGLEQDGDSGYFKARTLLLNKYPHIMRLFVAEQEEPRPVFLDFKDLRSLPKPQWLIYDVLPTKGISFAYGKPGCGKTFLATSLACSVALDNMDWIGRATKHGHVIYIAAEDIDEVAQRVLAWAQYHEVDDIPNIHFFPCSLNLAKDTDRFIESLEQQYGNIDIALFVVDTLTMCSLGVDENSKKDFDAVTSSLETLWRKYNSCVLAIYHAGKNGEMRGTSSMDGVGYSMISVSKDGETITLHSYKKRRGKEFKDIYLDCKIIETGDIDEMGEPVTICVLVSSDQQATGSNGASRLTKLQREILQHTKNLGGIDVPRTDLMKACQIERNNESSFVNAASGLIGKGLLRMSKEKNRTFYTLTELATTLNLEQL